MSTVTVRFDLDPQGYWTCSCGNIAESDGFFPCDADGADQEPEIGSDWDGTYRCDRCGQVYRSTPDGVIAA